MKRQTKRVVNGMIRTGVRGGRKIAAKNPRVKRYIKEVVLPYISPNILGADEYSIWVDNNYPSAIINAKLRYKAQDFKYKPLISLLTPTYNTDHQFLKECIDSVRAQSYENWELCIVDDASPDPKVREIIKSYALLDERIKYVFSEENLHIASASNMAAEMATGEFVSFLDHDDLLWPNALFEVVKALNQNKKLDFIYSDEDKITTDSKQHVLPFFKPDWNPEFLRSVNYITHFTTVRLSLFNKVGGFRHEASGAQDWDLFLRLSHETKNIHHIPTMLYSWRISENSTASDTSAKPYVVAAQKLALEEDLKRRRLTGTVRQNMFCKDYWTIDYEVIDNPKVSIVIPTKNQYKIIRTCIQSILEKTTYDNYEIVIVDTGTTDKKVLNFYKELQHNYKVTIINWHEPVFSYVRSCNEGARVSSGDYLVMLNNDTEVITPNWLQLMLGYAQQEGVATVGAKLYYPGRDKLIQHAGIGIGFGGYAANALAMMTDGSVTPQQHLYLHTTHAMSAVTAACLMVKKDKFDEMSGFSEDFRITYNDVDLGLRFSEAGYRNVYHPEVRLIHYESISLGLPEEKKKRDTTEFDKAKALFKKRWQKYIDHDPALNPNISKDNARLEIDTKHKQYN